ncbi:MAG: hypothetical protein KJ957_08330 [Candidatus Omnitrophica bacterium]|nr:hypothetical protein [Candidatus Omnitrophota bacterium]
MMSILPKNLLIKTSLFADVPANKDINITQRKGILSEGDMDYPNNQAVLESTKKKIEDINKQISDREKELENY